MTDHTDGFEELEKMVNANGDADRRPDDFGGEQWAFLLSEKPQYADRCDWSKLTDRDWMNLLSEQPQFAEKCPFTFNAEDWATLLAVQPQFADRVDAAAWKEMPLSDWMYLLSMQPQLCPYWPRVDTRSGDVRLSLEELLGLYIDFQTQFKAMRLVHKLERKFRAEGTIE